jgi:hypothetical protein
MAAIRTRLKEDGTLRKLLCYDGNDALLLKEVPEIDDVSKHITLRPVFEFENKEEWDQNSMINIYMTEATPFDDAKVVSGVVQINVVCNQDVWDLVDDKCRPIEIADSIIRLVDQKKFTVSNKLVFNTITDLIINKKVFGYALLFEITDGSGEKDKI